MNNLPTVTPNNGGNIMDLFLSQMMTMTMFSSMSGGNKKEGSTSDSLYGMLYILIITQLIDFLCKNLPIFVKFVINYYNDKLKSSQLVNSLSVTINNKIQIKSSSIIGISNFK